MGVSACGQPETSFEEILNTLSVIPVHFLAVLS